MSFILEWNGLKFAYSSDTFPNKWWMEYAKGVDLSIHEAFIAPESLVEKQGFTPDGVPPRPSRRTSTAWFFEDRK